MRPATVPPGRHQPRPTLRAPQGARGARHPRDDRLTPLALDAGDELTEHRARVLCAGLKAIERVAIAYGTALATQDTPLTLVVKALTPLLRQRRCTRTGAAAAGV